MTETSDYCVVLTTIGSPEEAEQLAQALITHKLAACVQITPITSYYTWNDALAKESEALLLIKTKRQVYAQVEELITRRHSYTVPEIVQLPIQTGLTHYLHWIDTQIEG